MLILICSLCLVCSTLTLAATRDRSSPSLLPALFTISIPFLMGIGGFGMLFITVLVYRDLPLFNRRPWKISLAIILSFILGVLMFIVSFVIIMNEAVIDFILNLVKEARY
jgi:VIT1/CCC1 family predicted Fe2+/Mn2+ transporter